MRILVSLLLISLSFLSGAQADTFKPEVHSFFNKKEIRVGEKVTLTFKMEWKQDEDFLVTVTRVTPPASALLIEADSKQSSLSRLTKDGVYAGTVLEYLFIGKEKGPADVSPPVIEYATSDNPGEKKIIAFPPVSLRVISRPVWLAKMALKVFLAVAAAALLLLALVLLKKYAARANKRGKAGSDHSCLEKKFYEKLQKLNAYKVSGETTAYYAGIERVLLEYLEEKYGGDFRNGLPPELQKIYSECKAMAEKVRFSGYKPELSEQDRLTRSLTKYIESVMAGEKEEDLIETIDSR